VDGMDLMDDMDDMNRDKGMGKWEDRKI